MNSRYKCLNCYGDVLAVLILMLCVFTYIMFYGYSDLVSHAEAAQRRLVEKRLFSDNFLMYFMANLLSGFSGNLFLIKVSVVFLISVSNTAKYCIVRKTFELMCGKEKAKLVSFSLLFVYIIPALYFLRVFGIFKSANTLYLEYINVPNVWHNSTILCMMPFAILTYDLAVKQFDSFDNKRNCLITLFVVLGALVKPSFFFVFAVAFPIVMFCRYQWKKEFFYSLVPVIGGGICLLYEYYSIYIGNVVDDSSVSISIMPLCSLGFWKSRWLYLMISLAFPILFLFLSWKIVKKDKEFWFVLIMLIMALGINWCCHETGPRAYHGNFSWQIICSMWFVFYYMLKTVFKGEVFLVKNNRTVCLNKRGKFFIGIYSLHVLMGVFYLVRYILTNSYY